jgi:hypothetical protein
MRAVFTAIAETWLASQHLTGAGVMLVGGAISLILGWERQPVSRITAETP